MIRDSARGWDVRFRFKRYTRWLRRSEEPEEGEALGPRGYAGLVPIKPARDGNALNKAGRLVLKGSLDGSPIKLYEGASPEHARFIQATSRHKALVGLFPAIVAVHGPLIVTEWVRDAPERPPDPEEFAALLLRLHRVPVTDLPQPGFDYWRDFLWPRFLRAVHLLDADELASGIAKRVAPVWAEGPATLMHPDLTPVNVVRSRKAGLSLVDNEMLTVGGLPLLDVCNTAYAMAPEDAQTFARAYLLHAGTRWPDELFDILRDAWVVRRVGSAFVEGDLETAVRIVDARASGAEVLPFIPDGEARLPG